MENKQNKKNIKQFTRVRCNGPLHRIWLSKAYFKNVPKIERNLSLVSFAPQTQFLGFHNVSVS